MSRAKLRNRRASALLLTLVILALSACLKIPPSGVAVKAVTAGLVFGVPPLPEPVAPPGFGELEVEETSEPSPSPTTKAVVKKPPEPPKAPCPKASDQTFPEEEASTSVKGLPKEGLYLWRTTFAAIDSNGKTLDSVTNDLIRGVTGTRQLTATDSRFSVGEFQVRGSSVDPNNLQGFEFRIVIQDFEIVQDGGTDDGIFLTRISEYEDENDRTAARFTPEPSIKILPLPVRAGLTLGDGNAGVDGQSLAVLRQTGTVTRRNRVDVCGVVIDSWFVDGEQQYTAPGGTSYTINYDYSVATQFGGYIAFEDTVEDRTTPTFNYSFRITQNIGSLNPFTSSVPDFFRP